MLKPSGVFLISPYTTFASVAKRHHRKDFYEILIKYFRSIDIIDKVKVPLLIIHGEKDKLIDCGDSEELFNKNKNNEKKKLNLLMIWDIMIFMIN